MIRKNIPTNYGIDNTVFFVTNISIDTINSQSKVTLTGWPSLLAKQNGSSPLPNTGFEFIFEGILAESDAEQSIVASQMREVVIPAIQAVYDEITGEEISPAVEERTEMQETNFWADGIIE